MHQLDHELPGPAAERLPRTVALIPDGSARWAARRGLSTQEGHMTAAAVAIVRARDACELGVEQLALYSFSSENWSRPKTEVDGLMNVFATNFDRAVEALDPHGIRIRLLGSRNGLPHAVIEAVDRAEAATARNNRMTLFVAINYGGRQELLDAAQRYTGGGEQAFRALLYAPDMQDPELIIRTGGERRLSNGFLWHSSYSELLFLDELWPDFTREHFEFALADFGQRERRMGGRGAGLG